MTKLEKKVFEITVWYRYVQNGEQEKDCDTHSIYESDLQQAVNKASDLYRTKRVIPFQFLHEGKQISPSGLTKMDMFNLTSPVL
jgi:hypothetical protein